MDESGRPQIGTKTWEFSWDGDRLFEISCNCKIILRQDIEDMEPYEIRDEIADFIVEHCGFEFKLAVDLALEVINTGSQRWFS